MSFSHQMTPNHQIKKNLSNLQEINQTKKTSLLKSVERNYKHKRRRRRKIKNDPAKWLKNEI